MPYFEKQKGGERAQASVEAIRNLCGRDGAIP
jgi:hypothetical protein